MKLVKVSENVNRNYNGESVSEEVTNVSYNICEDNEMIGSANISSGYLSVNVQMAGTMDEIKAKVESLFAE